MAARPSPGRHAAPLSIEPVIGWRAWALRWDGADRVELASPLQQFDWRPRQPSRARCASHPGTQVPNLRCTCGLYAVSRLERLPAAAAITSNSRIGVVGSVAMWGHVVEHANGYRAQLGYPDRLRLICRHCLRGGRDGVPIRIERVYGGDVEPVCEAHATSGRSFGREIEPEQLQQMVLSAYAVDLLPVEALHRAGFRAGPVPPSGLVPAARAELRQLRRGWSGVVAVASLVAALLIVQALGLFPSTGADDARGDVVAAVPIAVDEPFPAALDAWRPLGRMRPVPGRRHHTIRFGFLCGLRAGGRAEIVRCGRPGADLFGSYWSPPQSKRECRFGDAYSRKPRFSVCWLDFAEDPGPGLDRLRLPGVRPWDLAA